MWSLDYYLELIRKIHIRTYAYLGEMRASTNPLAYCEGGFYGGHLGLHDKIKPLFKDRDGVLWNPRRSTSSRDFITENPWWRTSAFAIEVLKHINEKVEQFKHEDGNLYAIYATPAENLCGLQVKQFRKKYGIIENVSDREYVSNGFHCHVTEDISNPEAESGTPVLGALQRRKDPVCEVPDRLQQRGDPLPWSAAP